MVPDADKHRYRLRTDYHLHAHNVTENEFWLAVACINYKAYYIDYTCIYPPTLRRAGRSNANLQADMTNRDLAKLGKEACTASQAQAGFVSFLHPDAQGKSYGGGGVPPLKIDTPIADLQ